MAWLEKERSLRQMQRFAAEDNLIKSGAKSVHLSHLPKWLSTGENMVYLYNKFVSAR